MARRKDKNEELDKERMTAAMRRLEDLLQNPDTSISGNPAVNRFEHEANGTRHATDGSREQGRLRETTAPQTAIAEPAPVIEMPGESVWAKRLGTGPDAPPQLVTKLGEDSELPKGVRPGVKKPAAAGSGGLFGVFLSWLLSPRESEIKDAIAASRRAFKATFLFSAVINILMMAGPLFLLLIYDRVLSSGSVSTLITVAAITAGLYGVIGMLELARSRIIGRIGTEIDQRLSDRIFDAALRKSVATGRAPASVLRELDSFRQFMSGPAPITFFDTPWTPVYLIVIFMMHWLLGITAVVGTAILLGLAWLSEQRGRLPLLHADQAVAKSLDMAETAQRNAEAITAMGMLGAYRTRWQAINAEGLGWQLLSSDRLGGMSAASKAMRLVLQSLMLAIAAGLAMQGAISAGAIIAATLIFGRALAPVEQIIGHWRAFITARQSCYKLEAVLTYAPPRRSRTDLPRPRGALDVQNIRVAAPEARNIVLNGIAFKVSPGQMLAIIGPSASGKSTLARAIVGLWPTISGAVSLDGARLEQWHPEDLGKHIGYLPQSVELFAGTIKQNIARFREDATNEQVFEAAKQAHAHDLILGLPKGYETELGNQATSLSGGQRQRIALARALFRTPPLVVLDEPNSNLDRMGDDALSAAIEGMRKRGQTVVLVSHRVEVIGTADLLLLLEDGHQRAFGPRAEVMKLVQGARPARRKTSIHPAPDKTAPNTPAARATESDAR